MSVGWIIALVVGALALIFIGIYNRLISLRNNREKAFADIDVQLKQRQDLVPQLVETVKGYASHEKSLLESITAARERAACAKGIPDRLKAESELGSLLNGLNVRLEAYPDLKASQNFLQLQGELSDLENKIAASRRYFNMATREYNDGVQKFPNNILANMFKFNEEDMFDVGEDERKRMDEPPKISFS